MTDREKLIDAMIDDIVKRLRDGVCVSPMGNILTAEADLTMEEAADEIEKLRAALKPFIVPDWCEYATFTGTYLRAAKAALGESDE